MIKVRPIRRFVLLLDDPAETDENGIVVSTELGTNHLDYYVVAVGTEENVDFRAGDRVVVSDPNAGRRIRIDGAPCRIVRTADVVAVIG